MFVLTRIGKANPAHSECPSITIEHSIQLARHSLGGSNVYSRSTPIGSLVIKPGKDTNNLYFKMGARGLLSKVKVNNVALTDKEEKLLQPDDQIQFFGRKTNPLSLYVVSVSAANANAETPSKKTNESRSLHGRTIEFTIDCCATHQSVAENFLRRRWWWWGRMRI